MGRYSLHARIYPVLLFILPIIAISAVFSLHFENYMQMGVTIGISGALSYLFAQLGRDAGKRKEKALWKEWGGSPTSQILRWRNDEIDSLTKLRYHGRLSKLCPSAQTPDKQFETANPVDADSVYLLWSKFLISQTRNTKAFPLLFKENISYGFRRNLWGMKPSAIALILLLMIGMPIVQKVRFPEATVPETLFIAEALLFVCLVFWLIGVRKLWIKPTAFAYAHRLLEAVDVLPVDEK